ncbi:MAG: hypothetical protein P4L53_23585 [Candidatus Obscuribacterales bacterium]|nr:hypothetical protein [Candidatus Obscuribacterales bacterium]
MLFKVEGQFGHLVEETEGGVIYQSDGSLVDIANPRPCFGCNAKCANGEQDPCIANLPGTLQACCGHGVELSPRGYLNGYVALADGRTMRFSGLVGGAAIRDAVEKALSGEELPEGFAFEDTRMWWSGLSVRQREYVDARKLAGLTELVELVNDGYASPRILTGEAMWYDGLTEEQKDSVRGQMRQMLQNLVNEARSQA